MPSAASCTSSKTSSTMPLLWRSSSSLSTVTSMSFSSEHVTVSLTSGGGLRRMPSRRPLPRRAAAVLSGEKKGSRPTAAAVLSGEQKGPRPTSVPFVWRRCVSHLRLWPLPGCANAPLWSLAVVKMPSVALPSGDVTADAVEMGATLLRAIRRLMWFFRICKDRKATSLPLNAVKRPLVHQRAKHLDGHRSFSLCCFFCLEFSAS